MELHLNLESLKFANVVNFNRTYGTKKTSTENGGSLTTYEFNNNNALPFDIQRPYIITEDSTVTDVQYDGKLLINANNTTVTLGTGTDGITLTVASLYNATITDGAVNYSIRAGQTLQFMYFDTSWHKLTEGEYFGTVADATTQIIDVAVSNYTGKKLPEGARLHIVFSSDYSYDGQPSFTINGGTEQVPVTVGNVPAGIGAFQQDKSYEFIFTGTRYDCLSNEHNAGTIKAWGGVVIPSGWLLCDGRAISRQNYKALFAVIGTTYGSGDGNTTFNIPDTRENVLVGTGQNTTHNILDHDVYNLGEFKDDQLQSHGHIIMQESGDAPSNVPGNSKSLFGAKQLVTNTNAIPVTSVQGARTGTTTHGKQLGINYIIKY